MNADLSPQFHRAEIWRQIERGISIAKDAANQEAIRRGGCGVT